MDPRIVTGDALTAQDVYDIWKIRDAVFAVEQRVDEEDVDGRDLLPGATHLWFADEHGPTSYLRVFTGDDGVRRVGRVCTRRDRRGRGLSGRLMEVVHGRWDERIDISAQAYLEQWYGRFGYVRTGDDFDEAGIAHTPMTRLPPRPPPAADATS